MTVLHSIGPFHIDEGRGVLLRDGQSVPVGQRAMALLLAMFNTLGQTVSKSDLMQAGWPGMAVEEGNLTVQIAHLRKALGPGPQGQDWIVTVPRVGYRLVIPQPQPPEPEAATRPALAVLPFQNLSGDASTDYFADGIVADIITALSRFQSLAVLSRNSTFVYKGRAVDTRQIARDLGADYLLEGSVRRSGERLRLTAQLVDGISGTTLWTERFDGDAADIFEFQDRITESVATLVAPVIESSEISRARQWRPQSAASYDIYLQARALLASESEANNATACALLTNALAAEPDNGVILAHASWALEHRLNMGWRSLGEDDAGKCLELARRGLRHADGNPRVLAHCAMSLIQIGRDYDGGMAVVQAAAQANPNDLMVTIAAGVATMHCGDLESALGYFRRAIHLRPTDPDNRISWSGTAMVHILRGEYEAALGCASRALALNDRFDPTYWMLIAANAHLGRMESARACLDRLLAIAPGITLARIRAGQPARFPRIEPVLDGMRLAGLPEG